MKKSNKPYVSVLAIVGSNNSESSTKKYIDNLLQIIDLRKPIKYEILTTGELSLKHCSG